MSRKTMPHLGSRRWFDLGREVIPSQHSRDNWIIPQIHTGQKTDVDRLVALLKLKELTHELIKSSPQNVSWWDHFKQVSKQPPRYKLKQGSPLAHFDRLMVEIYRPTYWGVEPTAQDWRYFKLNPLLDAALKCLRHLYFTSPMYKEETEDLLKYLQSIISHLQEVANDKPVDSRRRSALKRRIKIQDYLTSCFRGRPTPRLMLRVDLGATQTVPSKLYNLYKIDNEIKQVRHTPDIRQHMPTLDNLVMNHLLSRHKPPINWLRQKVGYLVKRQLTFDKGVHWHLLLILDVDYHYVPVSAWENELAWTWQELLRQQGLEGLCWGSKSVLSEGSTPSGSGLFQGSERPPIQAMAFYLADLDDIAHFDPPDNSHNVRHGQRRHSKKAGSTKKTGSTKKGSSKSPKSTSLKMSFDRTFPFSGGRASSQDDHNPAGPGEEETSGQEVSD